MNYFTLYSRSRRNTVVCVWRCSRTCGLFHTTLWRSSRVRDPRPIDFIFGGNKLSTNLSLSLRQNCLSWWKSWSRNFSGLLGDPCPSLRLRSDKMFKHTPGAGIAAQTCWILRIRLHSIALCKVQVADEINNALLLFYFKLFLSS